MFGSARRSPFRGLLLVALGFFLASLVFGGGSAATGVGLGLLVLPLFFLKMMFIFMMFGFFFRFAGMGYRRGGPSFRREGFRREHFRREHWHGRGRPDYKSDEYYPWERTEEEREVDRQQRDWEESLRQARADVNDLDAPKPRPQDDFEPPKP